MSHFLSSSSLSQRFFPSLSVCHWDSNSGPSQYSHHHLLKAYIYVSRVRCWQSVTPRQLAVCELWCQSSHFTRRCQALDSLVLGLAQHLQTFRGLELQHTTAGSGLTSAWHLGPVRSSAAFSRAKTVSWVLSRMQLSGEENYVDLPSENAMLIQEMHTKDMRNKHQLEEERLKKKSFSICPALYYYSKCIQSIILSVCFIISKLQNKYWVFFSCR